MDGRYLVRISSAESSGGDASSMLGSDLGPRSSLGGRSSTTLVLLLVVGVVLSAARVCKRETCQHIRKG
jgi:hypothetical protein